jgi:hypothetical protein
MEIDAQSEDRNKAAKIANAIAEAYIDDTLEAKYQATRRANVWLQDRLQELRAQVAAEQKAVVAFRQKNNISYVDTGGGKFYVDIPGKVGGRAASLFFPKRQPRRRRPATTAFKR